MTEIPKNIYGKPLRVCCMQPTTGFSRNGLCELFPSDGGEHTICIVATESFLAFSKTIGNDLSTPMPEYNFPGLNPGDKWCLCASRWKQAYEADVAPKIVISATHESMLNWVSLETLEKFAVDITVDS